MGPRPEPAAKPKSPTPCKCSPPPPPGTCKWQCDQLKKLNERLNADVAGGGIGGPKREFLEKLIESLSDYVSENSIDFNGLLEIVEGFLEQDAFQLGLTLSESIETEAFNLVDVSELKSIDVRNSQLQANLHQAMGNPELALNALGRGNYVARLRGVARLSQSS